MGANEVSRGTALVLVLFAMLAPACKGSDDLTGVRMVVTPDFVTDPNATVATPPVVTLEEGAIVGSRITLDVVVTDVSTPISGIAVKLTYPSAFSKFVSCTRGDLFASGDCFFSEPAPGSGEVFIGRSLLAPESAKAVAGSEVIVRLDFLVFGQDEGPIVFEAQNLGGGDASAVLDPNGDPILVSWFSGTLAGQ